MNRTGDELQTETDVMATAFSTTRKYGMNILTATQHMDINAYVKSDSRMPRTRLRRYLGQHGLRGETLELQGKIRGGVGEDYVQRALAYVVAQFPADDGTGR